MGPSSVYSVSNLETAQQLFFAVVVVVVVVVVSR
jgi:hypothetical protein